MMRRPTKVTTQHSEHLTVFDWLPQHKTAFSRMKELITQAPVLQYYDVNKEVSLECDSSEVGLGAVIKRWTPHCVCVHSTY